jgi:hypothetical protein
VTLVRHDEKEKGGPLQSRPLLERISSLDTYGLLIALVGTFTLTLN